MFPRKLVQCSLVVALTLVGVGGLPTSSPSAWVTAAKATPSFDEFDETFIDPYLTEICGFPVEVRFQSRLITQVQETTATTVQSIVLTYTNLENGRSVDVRTSGQERLYLDPESGESAYYFNGSNGRLIIPGQGAVAFQAGRHGFTVFFNAVTGEFEAEEVHSGVTVDLETPLEELICDALAG